VQPVLIVGGYGVVGQQVAGLLRQRHPGLSVILAGRSLDRAQSAARTLEAAGGLKVDLADPNPLEALDFQPSVILAAANDPSDHLLTSAVALGIPFVDVTRWTERMTASLVRLAQRPPSAPVILASGWLAGVVATTVAWGAEDLARVQSVDIDILFSVRDRAGPDSFSAAERLGLGYAGWAEGGVEQFRPLTAPRQVRFSDHRLRTTWRYDTPDPVTLGPHLGARRVDSRIAFDDPFSTVSLAGLVRSGLWGLISGPGFASLRRSLLFRPGAGASHEVRVEIQGEDAAGHRVSRVLFLSDPQGQTHMTAAGAVVQLERVLGLAGRVEPPAAVSFPEQAPDLSAGITALGEMGLSIGLVQESDPLP